MKSKVCSHRLYRPKGKEEKGRIYLFFGLGGTTIQFWPAITRFRKHGFSVVTFRFYTKAMLALTIENLPATRNEVCAVVEQYEQKRTSPQAIALGNSMGSVYAWTVAKRLKSVDKIVANTGYALISKHIFEDKIGKHWRNKLIAQSIDQATFHEAILESEPISNFDQLKSKKVLLFMNKDDNVIDFSQAKIFLDELDKQNIDYKYVENHGLRHGSAIMKNLRSQQLIDFLSS